MFSKLLATPLLLLLTFNLGTAQAVDKQSLHMAATPTTFIQSSNVTQTPVTFRYMGGRELTVLKTRYDLTCQNDEVVFFQNGRFSGMPNWETWSKFYLNDGEQEYTALQPEDEFAPIDQVKKILDAKIGENYCASLYMF